MKISLLINMKMCVIVGIFIFISRENFMLSGVEHEKKKNYNHGTRLLFFSLVNGLCTVRDGLFLLPLGVIGGLCFVIMVLPGH